MALLNEYPYKDHVGKTHHNLVKIWSNDGKYIGFINDYKIYEEIVCKFGEHDKVIELDVKIQKEERNVESEA